MTETELDRFLGEIEPSSSEWLGRAQARQNTLTKPPGSLGQLETVANRICAMRRTLTPSVQNAALYVFAGDHGVCAEGVNAFPQSVTAQMVANFTAGGAAINALARSTGTTLRIVDAGVIGPVDPHPGLLSRKIGEGTANICREPAMSRDAAIAGLTLGIDCAHEAIGKGAELLAAGEMGIGNTTVASALSAALTGRPPQDVCGRGTAASDDMLPRKREAVARAIELHNPYLGHTLELLRRLGGFEVAAIAGFCIGTTHARIPFMLDGFIATAAAAVAVALQPAVRDYLIAGHCSAEPGHAILLNHLQLTPLLRLEMRLGEGSGAAAAIPLVRAAVAAFREMATFESAQVSTAARQS